jgi:hypothetical protein
MKVRGCEERGRDSYGGGAYGWNGVKSCRPCRNLKQVEGFRFNSVKKPMNGFEPRNLI